MFQINFACFFLICFALNTLTGEEACAGALAIRMPFDDKGHQPAFHILIFVTTQLRRHLMDFLDRVTGKQDTRDFRVKGMMVCQSSDNKGE